MFPISAFQFAQDFPMVDSSFGHCFLLDYTIMFTWMEDEIFLCKLNSWMLIHFFFFFFLDAEGFHPLLHSSTGDK